MICKSINFLPAAGLFPRYGQKFLRIDFVLLIWTLRLHLKTQFSTKHLSEKTWRKTFSSENPKTISKTFLGFFHHEVSDDLSICILTLEFVYEKVKIKLFLKNCVIMFDHKLLLTGAAIEVFLENSYVLW